MALVLVQRKLEKSISMEKLAALAETSEWCFETNNVKWLQSLRSDDGRSVICMYEAPDVEAVRRANALAKVPAERMWAADKML